MARVLKALFFLAVAFLGLFAALIGYHKYRYPYGVTHCCDLILHSALEQYAAEHKGVFPASQLTPEASLSLLYPTFADAHLLGGKAVAESKAQEILDRAQPLSADMCGWHYVEGLTIFDHPHLALFWDKTGLGHAGQRLSCGGHTVLFVDGQRRHIPADEWDDFVKQQETLLAARRGKNEIQIDGELPKQRVHAQLLVIENYLFGRIWRDNRFTHGESIAHIDKESDSGIVGLPIVTKAELRNASVTTDDDFIGFELRDREIVCNGEKFRFVSLPSSSKK